MSRPPWILTKRVPPFFGDAGALFAVARSQAATVPRLTRTIAPTNSRRNPETRCVAVRILILAGADRERPRASYAGDRSGADPKSGVVGGTYRRGLSANRRAHSRTTGTSTRTGPRL